MKAYYLSGPAKCKLTDGHGNTIVILKGNISGRSLIAYLEDITGINTQREVTHGYTVHFEEGKNLAPAQARRVNWADYHIDKWIIHWDGEELHSKESKMTFEERELYLRKIQLEVNLSVPGILKDFEFLLAEIKLQSVGLLQQKEEILTLRALCQNQRKELLHLQVTIAELENDND